MQQKILIGVVGMTARRFMLYVGNGCRIGVVGVV